MRKIKVLVVDDSAVVRTLISKLLSTDPTIEVVGVAPDAYVAREMLVKHNPDVMTLDIEMPRLDGLNFLAKVMQHFPTRTIIISSLSPKGSQTALKALSMGAIDVIPKGDLDLSRGAQVVTEQLVSRIHSAAAARVGVFSSAAEKAEATTVTPVQEIKVPRPTDLVRPYSGRPRLVLAIAASTGGPEALRNLLKQLPSNIPPTVIVQHMPAFFTKSFAESLNSVCAFEVREAREGDLLEEGVALVAPGNYHMVMVKAGAKISLSLNQNPPLHGVRPAADPLFDSVARIMGAQAIGVVLTGMGRDGASGLLKMRESGSFNIAQDEETSVVFGMPKEAVQEGAIHIVCPLQKMGAVIMAEVSRRSVAKVS